MTIGDAESRFTTDELTQGVPCALCSGRLQIEEEAVRCNLCQAHHHAHCWDTKGGCGTDGCENAPLPQLAPDFSAVDVVPGKRVCPFCKEAVHETDQICPFCNQIITADGKFHGERENAPGAVAALVYGIVGIFFCQIILGLVAISKAKAAKEIIAKSPRYGGEGMATAGYVLGIIDVCLFVIGILLRAAMAASR